MDSQLIHSRGMPAESVLAPEPDVAPENVPDQPVPDDPGTGGPDDDEEEA